VTRYFEDVFNWTDWPLAAALRWRTQDYGPKVSEEEAWRELCVGKLSIPVRIIGVPTPIRQRALALGTMMSHQETCPGISTEELAAQLEREWQEKLHRVPPFSEDIPESELPCLYPAPTGDGRDFTLNSMTVRVPTWGNVFLDQLAAMAAWAQVIRAKADEIYSVSMPGSSASELAARHMIKQETECTKWLAELMRSGAPIKNRNQYKADAVQKFGIGTKAFLRSWASAVRETGRVSWSKPGPKSKRDIDTPIKS